MTSAITTFTGSTQRQSAAGINRAASIIGCEVRALLAVIQVEAGSSGFDKSGRPKMLFEPHVFYACLKRSGALQKQAVSLGLAYPRWGTRPYPPESYTILAKAMPLDPELACQAASWGLPQILGTNHLAAGYGSALDMVRAFVAGGEDEHLAAMARFITANGPMRAALIRKDWATFASRYNGPGYRKNHYDTKLAKAYAAAPRVIVDAAPVETKPGVAKPAAIVQTPAPFTPTARNEEIERSATVRSAGTQIATASATVVSVAAVGAAPPHAWAWLVPAAVAVVVGCSVWAWLAHRKAKTFAAAMTPAEPADFTPPHPVPAHLDAQP